MNMSNQKISIIIPIYNADKYLRICIDSVICQTYQNFQLILVDDGSTDKSWDICNEYVKKYPSKIEAIQVENGGASKARNIGMTHITGDYVCFVDADDTIEPHHLEFFVNAIEPGADIYVQAMNIYSKNAISRFIYPQEGLLGIEEIFNKNKLPAHGYTWAKMYKRTVLPCFDENIKFSEDLLAILKCLEHVNKIKYINRCTYNYYLRGNNNASSKIFPLEMEYALYCKYKTQIDKLNKIYNINLWNFSSVGNIAAMFFARIRNAMYLLQGISPKQRRDIYQKLDARDIHIIYSHRHINNSLVRIGYILLKHKFFLLTDAYFYFFMKLK